MNTRGVVNSGIRRNDKTGCCRGVAVGAVWFVWLVKEANRCSGGNRVGWSVWWCEKYGWQSSNEAQADWGGDGGVRQQRSGWNDATGRLICGGGLRRRQDERAGARERMRLVSEGCCRDGL